MSLYTDEILQAASRWKGIQSSPSPESLRYPQGIRVFKNAFIENWIARAHPVVPGLWVIPLTAALLWMGASYQTAAWQSLLFLTGFLSWTALEYAIHGLLFHTRVTPEMSEERRFSFFMLHGYHHEFPNDPGRLVMPIVFAWPAALLVGALFWFVLGPRFFYGTFSGLLIGYLAYDWIHFYVHHARARSRFGKFMHKYHAIHHYVDETHNFGISTPLWDYVCGNVSGASQSRSRREAPAVRGS